MLRRVESWDGWLVAVWEGRGGIGKKKGKQRRRVLSAEWVYNGFYRWTHRWHVSVGDSISDSDGESIVRLSQFESVGHPIGKIILKKYMKVPRHCTTTSV